MSLKGLKILVTGGSGFIGSSLIHSLNQKEANVINFDKSTGNDISNSQQIENLIKKKFDIIFHLAAFSGGQLSNQNPRECFEINTQSTVKLLESVIRLSPNTKIIISSSRLEYGNPIYLPVDEKHPTNPTSVYGLSKLAATLSALILNKTNQLRVTIFRTSNVYGPHTKVNFKGYNVINHFIDLAKNDRDLIIFGNGEQQRDYIYIDDIIKAFELVCQKQTDGEIYNLGYGSGISFKEMVEMIIKIVGKGRLKFAKWPKELKNIETGNYISDIAKVERLGFAPKISFKEGLASTINNSL